MTRTVDQTMSVTRGSSPSRWRPASSVVRTSRQAISTACEGAGASVYFETHPLQRIQRDVETLKGHVIFDWDRTTELAGRHSLGLESRVTDMV